MLKIFPSTLFHKIISIIVGDLNYILRATLDEGPRSNKMEHSYWSRPINWTPKAFRWGSKTNWGGIYMAPFWREIQLVWTKKWSSKESSWFGEPRCKLGSKVGSSTVFQCFLLFSLFFKVFFSLVLEVEIVQE
jgi:hypothetical protein